MKAYHGTNQNFKKLDVNKTSEYGLYFGTEKEVAESYGVNIHEVTLSYNNLCDLTALSGINKAVDLIPELREFFEEEGIEEIEEELNSCVCILQDSSLNLKNGKALRDELLKKLNICGHDAVKISDYTDGDEHESYVIFDNSNFKYAA